MIYSRATTNGGVSVLISTRQNLMTTYCTEICSVTERLNYLGVGSLRGSQVQQVAYSYKFNGPEILIY